MLRAAIFHLLRTRRHFARLFSIAVVLFVARSVTAVPVSLRTVETSAPAAEGHALESAIDGITDAGNGWQSEGANDAQQFAVFATEHPLSAAMLQLQFFFLEAGVPSHFQNFGVSITTDESPSLQGRWIPLLPETVTANQPDIVKATGRTVRLSGASSGIVITLRAHASFTGITGFRLRLRPALTAGMKRPAMIGAASDGHFRLTEFVIEAEPLKSSNIALGRQVYGSGPVPANLPKKNLTDGLVSTYSGPDGVAANKSYYFTLDLGKATRLDHIVVRGRADGTESDRLGRYRIGILSSTSENRRKTQWECVRHRDGSSLPPGGSDVIRPSDAPGSFFGDGIRIWNESGNPSQPQIAELEVYPALEPVAHDWLADGTLLEGGREIKVPAQTRTVSFTITCREPGLAACVNAYRWRIPGLSEPWKEISSGGRVELLSPPAGSHELQIQALHSDGIWDESAGPVKFFVAVPWWRDPWTRIAAIGSALLIAGMSWWGALVWRTRRRLALAEVHLELHRERLRIARDMHDEIGARLTYIALLADRTAREIPPEGKASAGALERLADNARSAVSALDDVVWAVSPQHDTVGSLADYLSDYMPAYLEEAGIRSRLDLQLADPRQSLSLTARQGLLMAVKEALQNVAKHAHARAVRLSMIQDAAGLEIRITDDGIGIGHSPSNGPGVTKSGVGNMHQRLAELGGSCTIEPGAEGSGTCARILLPAPKGKVYSGAN